MFYGIMWFDVRGIGLDRIYWLEPEDRQRKAGGGGSAGEGGAFALWRKGRTLAWLSVASRGKKSARTATKLGNAGVGRVRQRCGGGGWSARSPFLACAAAARGPTRRLRHAWESRELLAGAWMSPKGEREEYSAALER